MSHESLINLSLTVDDGPLQKFVQHAVAEALTKARNEITSVRREVKELATELADFKRDTADLKHNVIDKIIAVVEDVVSVMMTSPAGRSGLRKLYFGRRERELIQKRKASLTPTASIDAAQIFPHLEELESSGGDGEEGGGVDLDEERMKSLESGISQLQQALAVLKDDHIPNRERAVDKWMSITKISYDKLLDFLGLDYLASVESVARRSETESCAYLRAISDSINEQSRRFSSVETTMKLKIERDELEGVIFALKDMRGTTEATVRRCDALKDEVKSTIEEMKRSTTAALESKVPWTDFEAFKKGNGEAMRSLRDLSLSGQKEIQGLRKDLTLISVSIEEVEKSNAASRAHCRDDSAPVKLHTEIRGEAAPQPAARCEGSSEAVAATNRAGATKVETNESSADKSEAAGSVAVAPDDSAPARDSSTTKEETSLVKRRVYHATNAAYFNYAEVVPSSAIRVTTNAAEESQLPPKRRPQSALLIRK